MQRREHSEIDLQELFPDPIVMRLIQPQNQVCSVVNNSVRDSARVLCQVLLQDHMFTVLDCMEQRALQYYAQLVELNIEQAVQDLLVVDDPGGNSDAGKLKQLRVELTLDNVLDKNWKARLSADVNSLRSARAMLELLCRKARLAYDANNGFALDENGVREYP